jgi:hypothetical protein
MFDQQQANTTNKQGLAIKVVIGVVIFAVGIFSASLFNKQNSGAPQQLGQVQPQQIQQMVPAQQVAAQPQQVQQQMPQQVQQQAQQQVALPKNMNAITKLFVGKGVLTCAQKIEQVTSYLGANGTLGAVVFVPGANANQNVVSTSLEIVGKDKKTAYATISFSPNAANGCGVTYDAVAFWPKKCDVVAEEAFKGKKIGKPVQKNIKPIDLDANSKVFLMPVGEASCLSIKKEVLF